MRTNELEVADGYLLQSNFAAWCASCALNTSCPNSSNNKKKKKKKKKEEVVEEEEVEEEKEKKKKDREKNIYIYKFNFSVLVPTGHKYPIQALLRLQYFA